MTNHNVVVDLDQQQQQHDKSSSQREPTLMSSKIFVSISLTSDADSAIYVNRKTSKSTEFNGGLHGDGVGEVVVEEVERGKKVDDRV